MRLFSAGADADNEFGATFSGEDSFNVYYTIPVESVSSILFLHGFPFFTVEGNMAWLFL